MATSVARTMAALLACGFLLLNAALGLKPNNKTLETRACQPPHDYYKFCDQSLPTQERVDDLIARIKLSEKGPLLTARGWPQGNVKNLSRIGVPGFDWGENALHGNQVRCLQYANGEWRCPTSFPMPNALGAAFNRSLWTAVGAIIGRELRSLWLQGDTEASAWSGRALIGLDTWSPTINQPRDPRWGRFQEVPSEDPLVLSEYAVAYTRGAQEGEDSRYLQSITTLKHWDAYSLEDSDGCTRHNFNANVSRYDLVDTYFVPFKAAVKEGKAKGVMCSYNALNGVPTCSSRFLNHTLRGVWGFDGYVTSDTGAIEDIYAHHKYTATPEEALCAALSRGGCDMDSGAVYWQHAAAAIAAGTCAESALNAALNHTLSLRFGLGLFDDIAGQPYWHVPPAAVGSSSHRNLSAAASEQALVLLKNDNALLPLRRGKRLAVIGPHANASAALLGSYLGQVCPGQDVNDFACVQSLHQAIAAANAPGATSMAHGCDIDGTSTSGFEEALRTAKQADVLVVALGLNQSMEAEGRDRVHLGLPGMQPKLLAALAALRKPLVLLLFNGGPLGIGEQVQLADAIVEAFYPGVYGAAAVASVLFGVTTPTGRLPYTMYHANYTQEIAMSNMCMSCLPGRSYRYYNGSVVFPFGYGLSYSEFNYGWWVPPGGAPLPAGSHGHTIFTVYVTNNGGRIDGTTVLLYMRPRATALPRLPLQQRLIDFESFVLQPGETVAHNFTVSTSSFYVVNDAGDVVSVPGTWEVFATDGVSNVFSYFVFMNGNTTVVEPFPEGSAH